ncbi:MAG: sialidase family protein, partial [Bacteroidota bacterium]
MKRILLFVFAIMMGVAVFAQYKPIQKHRNVMATQSTFAIDNSIPGDKPANIYVSNKSILVDAQVMMTNYDLMTNGSMGQSRLYYFPDGSMSSTATWSQDPGGTWPGRGTGYNYSANGTTWGTNPTARVEGLRTGWPSICPCGPSGECIVSHQSATAPLVFNKRATKGTGTWTQTTLPVPGSGQTGMLWPRMISTGATHNVLHVIALTPPTGNGGTVYNGQDGALLYIKSTDGGATWGAWQSIAGMGSADYLAISGDDYCWANPRGDTICFVVSNAFMDTFIQKSTDSGATWTKTVVYASPYNLV